MQMQRTGAALLLVFAAAPALAQDDGARSVDGKLLDILRRRGVIDDAEYAELKTLEADLAKEADRTAVLDRRVEEMTARLVQDAPKISYKQGTGFGFKTADGNFSLAIGGRLQTRFSYEFEDDDDGDGDTQDDLPNFDTPRARLWLKGVAFDPRLSYEFQFDVGGDVPKGSVATTTTLGNASMGETQTATSSSTFTGADRLVELKDAFLNYEVSGKAFQVKAGQFKAPYSRHQLTSSGRQMFVDRAPTDRFFAPGRQKGLNLWGVLGGEKDDLFEYNVAVMDGEGENLVNNDEGLMWVGRVAFNPFGGLAYSEADFRSEENRSTFLLAVGLNGWYHQDDSRGANNADSWSVGADVTAAWAGLFFSGEIHYRENDRTGPPNDTELLGWFAELGYNLTPEWNVGLRFAEVDWDAATSQTAAREWLVVVGHYWHEHNLKVQVDFGRVESRFLAGSSDDEDYVLRVQAQLVF